MRPISRLIVYFDNAQFLFQFKNIAFANIAPVRIERFVYPLFNTEYTYIIRKKMYHLQEDSPMLRKVATAVFQSRRLPVSFYA